MVEKEKLAAARVFRAISFLAGSLAEYEPTQPDLDLPVSHLLPLSSDVRVLLECPGVGRLLNGSAIWPAKGGRWLALLFALALVPILKHANCSI